LRSTTNDGRLAQTATGTRRHARHRDGEGAPNPASTLSALTVVVQPPPPTIPPPTSREPSAPLCLPPPLLHTKDGGDGDALGQEAKDHLARWPALQVMAEVLIELRAARVSWWDPVHLRARFPLADRLRWLEQRPDLREKIAGSLTKLTLREARSRTTSFQAELIDATLDPVGDAQRLEDAFDPCDLVVYGPAGELWDEVVGCIPWSTELQPALVERLLASLLAERSAPLGTTRSPLVSPWQLRTAVDTRAWQSHLPARVRAAVDDARLHKELVEPGAPFSARDEIEIVTVGVLAASLPLRALRPVFEAATRVMGLERPAPPHSQPAPKASFAEIANDVSDPSFEVTASMA
jgi:hypothetical protein